MNRLCSFCLDEPGACAHPECPQGPSDVARAGPDAVAQARSATRPSVVGEQAAEVLPSPTIGHANPRPPHIATAPSVVK